jgi:hypothetical protein
MRRIRLPETLYTALKSHNKKEKKPYSPHPPAGDTL